MIKYMSVLTMAVLMSMSTFESESWGQGFGGFHGASRGRNVAVARRVGYRGYYRYPSVGYGYGYGNVGNPYGAVGGVTTVGGVRVGGGGYNRPTAANLALADMAFARNNNRPAPTGPAPGPGPVGIDSFGVSDSDEQGTDSRAGALNALNKSLNQTRLPSDAGLTPARRTDAGSNKK